MTAAQPFVTKVPRVPGLLLRAANPADVPLILGFIRALADYERMSDDVEASETDLGRALFGADMVADVVLAEYDGESAGFALYFRSFSTFVGKPGIYLEDLFVHEHLRGKGIGKALLAFLAAVAVARGGGRLEWSVLDWNEPSLRFYRSLGAVGMDGWTVHRLAGDALRALAGSIELEHTPI